MIFFKNLKIEKKLWNLKVLWSIYKCFSAGNNVESWRPLTFQGRGLGFQLLKKNKIESHAFRHDLGKPSKKNKIKSVDFFHTGAGGGQPQIHTFLKVWIFKGGWGVLGPISTLFCPILFFLKNFVLFYPFFVGWNVIFRVKLKKIFFPPKCVSTL